MILGSCLWHYVSTQAVTEARRDEVSSGIQSGEIAEMTTFRPTLAQPLIPEHCLLAVHLFFASAVPDLPLWQLYLCVLSPGGPWSQETGLIKAD